MRLTITQCPGTVSGLTIALLLLPGLDSTSKAVPQQALVRGLLTDGAGLRFEAAREIDRG